MRDQELSDNPGGSDTVGGETSSVDLDIAFLEAQVLADRELEQEILTLFINQSREVLTRMADEDDRQRLDSAHLLKGSARSIGAFAAAAAAAAYELAPAGARDTAFRTMVEAFGRTDRAIMRHLAQQTLGATKHLAPRTREPRQA